MRIGRIGMTLEAGQRVVVRTPDRREFRGRFIELRARPDGKQFAVVRLDSGWLTSYPMEMVHPEL